MKKFFILSLLMLCAFNIYATDAENKKESNQLQSFNGDVFDVQRNTVSNVDFFNSNYGIFGQNVSQNSGGLYWPRGSQNLYIFGGGVWFGAQKIVEVDKINSYCVVSYDPNNGTSWMVPGRIDDENEVSNSLSLANKNRLYISTEYNLSDGTPNLNNYGYNWPLWITDNTQELEYGTYRHTYVTDTNARNFTDYPMGPLFVSDEDMYSQFKDTDLNHYFLPPSYAELRGYPLKAQFEQNVFTWGSEGLQDVVILFYTVENKSTDTLLNCWFAPMYDADLVKMTTPINGAAASNDRCRYFDENPNLNLAVMWTETSEGEAGQGFGYMGYSFIESPAVDANGFIRNDQEFYEPTEQLGLKTFKNWNISEDLNADSTRYTAMSTQVKDGDFGAGDKRIMFATGPFNMRPGDKARVAIALSFAMPAKGGEADGTTEDIQGGLAPGKYTTLQGNNYSLVDKLNKVQASYYQSILTVDDNTEMATLNIEEVYPNPTNKVISINYKLENAGNISLGLFNQLGEEVQNFYTGYQSAGKQSSQYQLNTSALSAGVYYIKVQCGAQIKTKAVSIVK